MADYTAANGYAPSSYPPLHNLRQVLHPEYAMLPHEQLSELMENMYGPDAAERYDEYLEGIFGDIGNAFSSAARDVGRFAAKAAPIVATVGGGALQGAMAGSSAGWPGMLMGAVAGGTGAGLSKYGSGTARDIGGALTGVTNIASQFSPMGRLGSSLGGAVSGLAGGGGRGGIGGAAVSALGGLLGSRAGGAGGALGSLMGGSRGAGGVTGALGSLMGGSGGAGGAAGALGSLMGNAGGAGGVAGALGSLMGGAGRSGSAAGALTSLFGGSSAAGQLMSLLQRPETMQALAALNLGPIGRQTIPLGSARESVPTSAFTNLIGQLSTQACADAAAMAGDAEGTLGYMTDSEGEFVGDPALARDRAARVWTLLNEAQAERVISAVARYRQESAAEAAGESYGYESYGSESYAPEHGYYDAAHYEPAYTRESQYYDAIDMADIYAYENANENFAESYGDAESLFETESVWP